MSVYLENAQGDGKQVVDAFTGKDSFKKWSVRTQAPASASIWPPLPQA